MIIEILKDIAKDIKEKSDKNINIDEFNKYLDNVFDNTEPKIIKDYSSNT